MFFHRLREYGFIAPYDAPKIKTPANLVSMEDLSNWTKYLKNNHILLFMDCCFSGFTALRSDDTIRRKSSLTEYSLDKYLNTKSRIVINLSELMTKKLQWWMEFS